MIGKRKKMHYCLQLIVPVVLLAVVTTVYSDQILDYDQDGIADAVDADHDNDGVPNAAEGFLIVDDPGLFPVDRYRSLFDSQDTAPRDQGQGSSFIYPLSDIAKDRLMDFQGTILSTNTSINWTSHNHSPKLQHERPGWSYVRWNILDAAARVVSSVDIDLYVTDLDVERSEAVEIEKRFIIGYSLASQSAMVVTEVDDKLLFTAANSVSGASAGTVVLHVRGQRELVIGYKSAKNLETLPGLNNDRAGFRHEFSGSDSALQVYVAIQQQRDTDQDGRPDHLDLDSDNDGLYDVVEALGVDIDNNGTADGIVNSIGIPASAGSGLVSVDANGNGIPDHIDIEPVKSTAGSFAENENSTSPESSGDPGSSSNGSVAELPLDTDNDGLTDIQELYLGTNPGNTDTDGDGFSDREEVVIFHSDPLSAIVESTQQEPEVAALTEYGDSDNDGIADIVETLFDVDGDGVPNQFDLDSDNDGMADVIEAGFTDLNADGRSDSLDVAIITEWDQLADLDKDGIPDVYDLDSDHDGITDLAETGETDSDDNGVVDTLVDSNGDGWHDHYQGLQRVLPDIDDDGLVDYLDPDAGLPFERQPATIQSDPITADGTLLHTGLNGGAGCALNTNARDYSLLLLALFAFTGLMVRRRDWEI